MEAYSTTELATRYGVTTYTLAQWRKRGLVLPPPIFRRHSITGKGTGQNHYGPEALEAVDAFLDARRAQVRKPRRSTASTPRERKPGEYSMDDIVEMFGVSKHTIYAHVQTGRVSKPFGGRRHAYYTEQHIEELRKSLARYQTWVNSDLPTVATTTRRSFSATIRAQVWEASKGHCHYCLTPLNPFKNFTIDHIVPVARGGTNDFDNLVAACKTCNSSKHTQDYELFVNAYRPSVTSRAE